MHKQQHLKANGLSYKIFNTNKDHELCNGYNDDNLSRGLSLESYHSLYEAEQQQSYGSTNDDLGHQVTKRMLANDLRVNVLNGQHTAGTFQHAPYDNEAHERNNRASTDVESSDVEANTGNINPTTLASNKAYRKFVLPLDIPTPPMPQGYNLTKRLFSSHNQQQTACQCDKLMNFTQPSNMNLRNQVNHISFIETTTNTTTAQTQMQSNPNQHLLTATIAPTKNQNLTLLHTKSSSSSSTLSVGSMGCSGVNLNATEQHAAHNLAPLQHHHLCQEKNFQLQHSSNRQECAAVCQHHRYQQLQQHHAQQHTTMSQCQLQQQHKQLSLNSANASQQQHLPQLPQLLSLHGNNNSLTLSQRRMASSFNRIADKNYMQDFSYPPRKLRNVRIMLAVFGSIILLGLLCVAIVLVFNSTSDSNNEAATETRKGVFLEDVIKGKLMARHFNGSWTPNGDIIYKEHNAIMEYNVVTKEKRRLLLDKHNEYFLYEKSPDGLFLLLARNYRKAFRHSFTASYDVYDIDTGILRPLRINNQEKPLIFAQWAPTGNAVVFNYNRNLYYKPMVLGKEIALTDDTNIAILNGIPDWVYEEEVFSSNTAIWFNPTSDKLAFIQFDDSATNVINLPVYGETNEPFFQYPFPHPVVYPKAGSPNPRVKLFISDLNMAESGMEHLTNIPVPSALNTESDYIITVVNWLNSTSVLSIWMNRIQNQAHMQIFNGLRRQEVYSLVSKTGWIDFFSPPFKNHDGSRIAFIEPQPQGADGDYRHLVVMSTRSSNEKPEALTQGRYVVTSILHWDTTHDIIFYTANTEKNPEQLHVYAIRAAKRQTANCLTCNIQASYGVEQTYFNADFNTNNHVVITSLGPSLPQSVLYEWSYSKQKTSGKQITLEKILLWESNEQLKLKLADIAMPTFEIETIPIANGFKAKVLLQYPPNMDRSGMTKYPLLVDVYGGPDSFSVVNRWIMDWGTYLSTNQSVIYAKIDGRGSGLRGDKLLHSVYLHLGTMEIDDQINVTRQLQKKHKFIDAKHTGIWGWSYGGYAAAMALALDKNDVFSCAASVAPVTDWLYYDSIYTERYMGLPGTNTEGYAKSCLNSKAKNLRGKKFLLAHGTLDDNVHYQQSMVLAKNLEKHVVLFKQISYTDEDHALAGVRPHLYHSLDKFFGDCFAKSRLSESQ